MRTNYLFFRFVFLKKLQNSKRAILMLLFLASVIMSSVDAFAGVGDIAAVKSATTINQAKIISQSLATPFTRRRGKNCSGKRGGKQGAKNLF
jgi:hypothetical protein